MELFINFLAVCFFAFIFLFCAKISETQDKEKITSKILVYTGLTCVGFILFLTINFLLTIIELI